MGRDRDLRCGPGAAELLATVLALGLVLALYGWTASSTANPFEFRAQHEDFYNLLTDALLSGQLHLQVSPRPELLRLADPYEPRAARPYRVHDLSLYRGRYYLYFGVVPALALFVPWRASGLRLPENLAAVLFMFAGVVWAVLTLRRAAARSERRLPLPLLSASVLLLGLSSFQPFVLRRPSVYEVAVAAGYCFLSAAGYFLLRSMEDTRGGAVSLALASLCLGLAVGSRPNHIVAAPLLLLAWARRRSPADLARALGPLAACVFLLLLYNRARFGDWLEFGQHYVLASHRAPGAMLFSVIYLPSHALAYLFWPVVPALEFPFFHLRRPGWALEGPLEIEPVAGLLSLAPVASLALAWLAPALRAAASGLAPIGAALLALGLSSLLFVSAFAGINPRYLVDFGPPLLLSAALAWVALDAAVAGRARRWALHLLLGAVLLYGLASNLALSLKGYYDWFHRWNPSAYTAIEDRFVPLQRLLVRLTHRYGDLRMEVRFPTAGTADEALVSAGALDTLCVRHEADRVSFRFRHGSEKPLESRPLPLAPGTAHRIEVSMGSLLPPINARALGRALPELDVDRARRSLRVRVDGAEVLNGAFDFTPVPASAVGIGRNATGPECPRGFGGEVLSVERRLP